MQRRTSLPTFYDVYQFLLAVIGMVGVCRLLFGFSWPRSLGIGVLYITSYWLGMSAYSLVQPRLQKWFQKNPRASED